MCPARICQQEGGAVVTALKKYKVERAGSVYHVLTTEADAKRRGLEPVEAPVAKAPVRKKAARPANKAAKPADK